MRKDYLPVAEESIDIDETTLVKDTWERTWEGMRVSGRPGKCASSQDELALILPYLRTLPPRAKVLDAGCGLGDFTILLQELGFQATGVDISDRTIARLCQLGSDCQFSVADIRSLDFPDESFDAYCSWGVFEHFEIGLGPCFEEARRVLKKGSYLFISVPFDNPRLRKRDLRPLASWDGNFRETKGYARPMRFYQWRFTIPELTREFELHGFRCLSVTPIRKYTGIRRLVHETWDLDPDLFAVKVLRKLISPFVSKHRVAHMILGIGEKR